MIGLSSEIDRRAGHLLGEGRVDKHYKVKYLKYLLVPLFLTNKIQLFKIFLNAYTLIET